ncbi:MAG: hypothetical protein IJU70_11050 [Lentisphaeria bacterium]|nr:hypothetical protein [Lentisphaeria bacterium]
MFAAETGEAADRGTGNYRLLLRLNFFLGIGLGVVSTAELFDLLYLRMGFDLSWFGVIRGSMFLLPALSYFAAAPLLKGTRRSREIVQWSFLVRIAAAVLIPLAALYTKNRHGLLAAASLCTSVAFVAAVFGSNTLMMLYRQLLPEEEFNRRNAVITAIFNIVPGLVGLLGAGVLSLASGLADREFYMLFILLETGTGIFELALFRINKKLTFSAGGGPAPEKISYADHFRRAFAGFRCPVYRQFLLITAANHFFRRCRARTSASISTRCMTPRPSRWR